VRNAYKSVAYSGYSLGIEAVDDGYSISVHKDFVACACCVVLKRFTKAYSKRPGNGRKVPVACKRGMETYAPPDAQFVPYQCYVLVIGAGIDASLYTAASIAM
jgi:hypothetical protein